MQIDSVRNDCSLWRSCFPSVCPLGYRLRTLEQRALEIRAHEAKGYHHMLDAQTLAMSLGKGYLTGIMITAVVERHSKCDTRLLVVEQRHGIHAATEYDHCVFFHFGRKGTQKSA